MGTENDPRSTTNYASKENEPREQRDFEPPTQCIDEKDKDKRDDQNRLGVLPESEKIEKGDGLPMESQVRAAR